RMGAEFSPANPSTCTPQKTCAIVRLLADRDLGFSRSQAVLRLRQPPRIRVSRRVQEASKASRKRLGCRLQKSCYDFGFCSEIAEAGSQVDLRSSEESFQEVFNLA